MYTTDHRDTGRSTVLDCVAVQVTTTGSPLGKDIDPSEVPACAQDLQNKYGDLASFSVTSAATDLTTFISKYTNGASTLAYGGNYGTMLTEWIMHLTPPEVTGYGMDGIASASGSPADEFMYASKWDIGFREVSNALLALCEDDSNCNVRFMPNGLSNTLQGLIEKFDNDPNSTCAALIKGTGTQSDDLPSFTLRFTLGTALMDLYACSASCLSTQSLLA